MEPVYGGVKITRRIYCIAVFFCAMNELQDAGYIGGGPKVDMDFMRAAKAIGEPYYDNPTREELRQIMIAVQEEIQ